MAKITDVFDRIVDAKTEEEVIDVLFSISPILNFSDSRFYDVHKCPFSGEYFLILNSSSMKYKIVKNGYEIYDSSIEKKEIIEGKLKYENDKNITNTKKLEWIMLFNLNGKGWVDIPIKAGDVVFGLWCLTKEGHSEPKKRELDILLRISSIAGFKISQLRQMEKEKIYDELYNKINSYDIKNNSVVSYMKILGNLFDSQSLAYFRYDPVYGKLIKVCEVYSSGGEFIEAESGDIDDIYKESKSLTGAAWSYEKFRYIPDFSKLMTERPDLVDRDSLKYHNSILNTDVNSVIYSKIEVPGSTPGLLRAMNKRRRPELRYSSSDLDSLDFLSKTFADTLATRYASERIGYIWDAFSRSLSTFQKIGLDFKSISDSLAGIGFPKTIISIWAGSGELVDFWTGDRVFSEKISMLGSIYCKETSRLSGVGIYEIDSLPIGLHKMCRSLLVDLVYIVPVVEALDKGKFEVVMTIVPLKISTNGILPSKEGCRFWERRPFLLKSIDVLGRLASTMRQLERNRSMLIRAGETIGAVGHEMRNPISKLINLASRTFSCYDQLLCQVGIDFDLNIDPGISIYNEEIVRKKLTNTSEALKDLYLTKTKYDSCTNNVEKIVSDALNWAKASGETIEMHIEDVNLYNLIYDCIDDLKYEIYKKIGLKIQVRDNVKKIGKIPIDRSMMHIVFLNIIDNAVKYSHNPGLKHDYKIKIYCERQSNFIDINFENWGLGIHPSDYENIFKNFYRSKTRDRVHTVRGVGMGLPTCRKFVLLHNGKIKVFSEPTLSNDERIRNMEGYKTIFTVRLPLDLTVGRVDVVTERKEHS